MLLLSLKQFVYVIPQLDHFLEVHPPFNKNPGLPLSCILEQDN